MAIPLKRLRESRGITQAKLSSMLSISPSTVGMWEQGRRDPDYENLKRIADYFNVSTDYLLGREDKNKNFLLSDEQKNLLKDFDSLNADGRTTLCTVLNALLATHSARNVTAADM